MKLYLSRSYTNSFFLTDYIPYRSNNDDSLKTLWFYSPKTTIDSSINIGIKEDEAKKFKNAEKLENNCVLDISNDKIISFNKLKPIKQWQAKYENTKKRSSPTNRKTKKR